MKFFCYLLFLSLFACTSQTQNMLKGEVEGLQVGDRIYLTIANPEGNGKLLIDSTVITRDGQFLLKTGISGQYISLYRAKAGETFDPTDESGPQIFLEGYSRLRITGDTGHWHYLTAEGGLYEHPDMQTINRITREARKIQAEGRDLRQKSRTTKDTLLLQKGRALILEANRMLMSLDSLEREFIIRNPDVAYSAALMRYDYDLQEDMDQYEAAFNRLSPRVQATPAGKEIATFIRHKRASEPGTTAPDFGILTEKGDTVRLSDYRGKYVLLDFWGSWCGPCRESRPALKALYEKIKDRNIVLIGIACDEQRGADWKKVVEAEGLSWLQVNDHRSLNGSVQKLYAVDGVPTCFLIDPAGKILYKDHPLSLLSLIEQLLLK